MNIKKNDVKACLLRTSNLMNNETRFDSAHTLLKFDKCAKLHSWNTYVSFHVDFAIIFVAYSHCCHIVSLAYIGNIITNVIIWLSCYGGEDVFNKSHLILRTVDNFFNGALPLGCVQAVILIVMKVICKLFGQNNNNNKNNNNKCDIMYTRTELCE